MPNGKKILMVIAPKDFRDVEYSAPRDVFLENGFDIKTASIQKVLAKGADGLEVNVDLVVSEAKPENFDAVVFIGGPGMAQITGDESLQLLADNFYKVGKVTAAICVAPEILAYAGLLAGQPATAYSGSKSVLVNAGALWQDDPVVASGKLITGNGPNAARQFGEKVAAFVKGAE